MRVRCGERSRVGVDWSLLLSGFFYWAQRFPLGLATLSASLRPVPRVVQHGRRTVRTVGRARLQQVGPLSVPREHGEVPFPQIDPVIVSVDADLYLQESGGLVRGFVGLIVGRRV